MLNLIYNVVLSPNLSPYCTPQEPLSQRVQQDIITELRTPEKLRESLDVVDIVLGLVSSGGGNHDVSLHNYTKARRMNKKPFSIKVIYVPSTFHYYMFALKCFCNTTATCKKEPLKVLRQPFVSMLQRGFDGLERCVTKSCMTIFYTCEHLEKSRIKAVSGAQNCRASQRRAQDLEPRLKCVQL